MENSFLVLPCLEEDSASRELNISKLGQKRKSRLSRGVQCRSSARLGVMAESTQNRPVPLQWPGTVENSRLADKVGERSCLGDCLAHSPETFHLVHLPCPHTCPICVVLIHRVSTVPNLVSK